MDRKAKVYEEGTAVAGRVVSLRPAPHLARNPITLLGGLLAPAALGGLVFFVDIQFLHTEPTPYLGFFVFVVLPALLVLGLLLIPAGIWIEARRRAAAARKGKGVPPALRLDFGNPRHLLGILAFTAATAVILAVLGATGYGAVEFMESTAFCGTCHAVMQPQVEAHERSAHAGIECTACHIGPSAGPVGPGAGRYVESKIGGLQQTLAVITNSYDRPVRAPEDKIHPARETCEECHAPEKDYGLSLSVYRTYLTDEANSPHMQVLALRVGSGANGGAGIHWHATAELYYQAVDEERQVITWASLDTPQGRKEWVNPGAALAGEPEGARLMDCIDCHNRVGHRIPNPEELVDEALAQGQLDASLPFLKREALRLLGADGSVADTDVLMAMWAQEGWFEQLAAFYQDSYPAVALEKQAAIQSAIEELKRISRAVLYPDMRTSWLTYPDNNRHSLLDSANPGCFRCHGTLVSRETGEKLPGAVAGQGCMSCHGFSENGELNLGAPDPGAQQACALCHVSMPAGTIEETLPGPASLTPSPRP